MDQDLALPPYESYKIVENSCFQEIPVNWVLSRVAHVSSVIDPQPDHRAPALASSDGFPYIGIRDVNPDGTLNFESARQVKESAVIKQEKRFVIEEKDIVFGKVGTLGFPKHIKPHGRMALSATLVLIKGKSSVDRDFLKYALDADTIYNQIDLLAAGATRPALGIQQLRKLNIPLPPPQAQRGIGEYLDKNTLKIDESIAKKQRLIDLLKEQKVILINYAVTKGLNLDLPKRESGVEWIGEVPEHWNGKKAKFLFTQSRLPVQREDDVVTAYRDGQVTLRSNRRTEGYTIAILEQGYQGIRKGQLVLNSMDAFAGAIGVSDSDGKCSPEYVICDPIDQKEVAPMYYALLLREMALSGYIEVISSAVRQRAMRIRFNDLSSLLLPVPPLKEQIKIVERVSDIKDVFDAVMDILNHEIELIKEYRMILITNTVTGKFKI